MKRFLRKKLLIVMIAGLSLLLLLGGCGKKDRDALLFDAEDGSGNKNKVSLTFFGFKADAINLTAIENALQSFMAENKNIDIRYEGIKGSAYWEAFDKRDAANVLDDVFMMHHDHVISMSTEGKLLDLSQLAGVQNYSDSAKGQFTNADGTVYFLPTQISTYNLYINYDLLQAKGQSIPQNWADFQKCCDAFVREGIVPIIANNRNSLATLIISKGLFDVYQQPDIETVLQKYNEDPAKLAADLMPGIEQVAEMLERGWFDPAEVLATEQTSDDLELFLKGDRPFMISGGWASVRVMAKNPGFSYGVHPYPILDDGCVLSLQVDTCISVNANSEHLEEAKRFVEYLIQPDVMWAYCDSQASYTPLKEEKRTPSETTLAPSMEYLTNGRMVIRSEYRLELPIEAALQSCSKSLLNGDTTEEAQAVLLAALTE